MKTTCRFPTRTVLACLLACALPVHAEVLVVGIDRKFAYDASATRQALQPGHDEVLFFDVSEPRKPRRPGSVRLENSILGPPTNVAVTPDQSLAWCQCGALRACGQRLESGPCR